MTPLDHKVGQLQAMLAGLDKAVVCFSGGVDSAYLLAEAVGVLGGRATALTAVSPSLAPEEGADDARAMVETGSTPAATIRRTALFPHEVGPRRGAHVETFELDDPRYASESGRRRGACEPLLFLAPP